MGKISRYFSKQDMGLLRMAGIKKRKYKRTKPKEYKCKDCGMAICYKTIRCPSCESPNIKLSRIFPVVV